MSNPQPQEGVSALATCTRHPNLYYRDGTIVLLAGTTLFRVYKGVLSRESEVFRSMLAGSENLPADADTYNGCPLVRLHDEPEDLAYFLGALMGHVHILDEEEVTDLPFMPLAILRLSHKYMARRHWKKVLKWFEKRIPTKAEEVEKKVELYLGFWDQCVVAQLRREMRSDLVQIFRGCGLHRFLPWVIHVMIYSQSSLITPKSLYSSKRSWTIPISDETKEFISNAFDRLERLYRQEIFKVIRSYHQICRRAECNDSLRLSWLQYMTQLERPMWLWKPSFLLPSFRSWAPIRHQPCADCLETWEKESERASKETWDKLPMICGLPNWTELRNEDLLIDDEDSDHLSNVAEEPTMWTTDSFALSL